MPRFYRLAEDHNSATICEECLAPGITDRAYRVVKDPASDTCVSFDKRGRPEIFVSDLSGSEPCVYHYQRTDGPCEFCGISETTEHECEECGEVVYLDTDESAAAEVDDPMLACPMCNGQLVPILSR